MPPSGETFRFSLRFGENVPCAFDSFKHQFGFLLMITECADFSCPQQRVAWLLDGMVL